MRSFRWIAVLISALLFSGCATTSMQPARPLSDGETVTTLYLDEPGFLYIPRAGAQVTKGLGGGDVSANVSASVWHADVGVGGRAYLSDRWSLMLQNQTAFMYEYRDGTIGWNTSMLAVRSMPPPDGWFYGGWQGGLSVVSPAANEVFSFGTTETTVTVPFIGGMVGVGPFSIGEAWTLQVELQLSAPLTESDAAIAPARLSVGFLRR